MVAYNREGKRMERAFVTTSLLLTFHLYIEYIFNELRMISAGVVPYGVNPGSDYMTDENQSETPTVRGKSMYRYIADAWSDPSNSYVKALNHDRKIQWRREENFHRIERPTRLDRARALGYKAKQGYVLVRAKVRKGSFRKRSINKGRRAKRKGELKLIVGKSLQRMAEERTQKRYQNLEVLNSYWVGADGQNEWYEVILVDPASPVIMADPKINWICDNKHKNRVYRGLTAAGKKGRGLNKKGRGAERARPSAAAHGNKRKRFYRSSNPLPVSYRHRIILSFHSLRGF